MELLFSLFMYLIGWWSSVPVEPSREEVGLVVRVIDGDTIDVQLHGTTTRVRYIGIDTPEPYRDAEPACFSEEASARNAVLVAGQEVRLVADQEDKDRYDRLLRYVYVDNVFINQVLIEEGYAVPLPIAPNTTYARVFKRLADEAASEARGLWSACQ